MAELLFEEWRLETLAVFTPTQLNAWADPQTVKRGTTLFKKGGVSTMQVRADNGRLVVKGLVDDGGYSPLSATVTWNGASLTSTCTCPLSDRCKHAVALALAFLDAPPVMEAAVEEAPSGLRPGQDVILYGLWVAPPPKKLESLYSRPQCLWLALDVAKVRADGTPGPGRPMPIWAPQNNPDFRDEDRAILAVTQPYYQEHGRDFSSPYARGIPLREAMVGPVLAALRTCPFVFGGGRNPVSIQPDRPLHSRRLSPWDAEELVSEEDGTPIPLPPGRLVGQDPAWILLEDSFRPVIEAEMPEIPELDEEPAPAPAADAKTHAPVKPSPRLTLSEESDRLLVKLTFTYGTSTPISPTDMREVVGGEWQGEWGVWQRDGDAEAAHVKRLSACGLDARGNGHWLGWGDAALGFLVDEVPQLIADGWQVFGEERLNKLRVTRSRPRVSLRLKSGIDWLDLTTRVDVDGMELSADALRDVLKGRSRFVKLGNGAYAKLPTEWLAAQRHLGEALGFEITSGENGLEQRLPPYMATWVNDLLQAADMAAADDHWETFLPQLSDLDSLPERELPEGFQGELRPYQRKGIDFLSFLAEHGLHGILADDMGLGKTIQAIALLLRDKEAGKPGPSLLVAPTSVVYNWEQELSRFAPGLKTLVLHGSARRERFGDIAEADVVVTSYALLRRDQEFLSKQTFHYLILDEAQNIKNPQSQAAKAASKLQARHRLCLTGTPLENNLLELWSLFNFLMPGLLGTERRFRETYLGAMQGTDPEAMSDLRHRTRPFILRRLKTEVAQDLPPRTEMVAYCELGTDQRRFYNETLMRVRGEIFATVDRLGMGRAHLNILEALLRLRQICCDPMLVSREEREIPSAKMDLFMEMVGEIIAEGHRVLVFSQFVKVLQGLRTRLTQAGVATEYLDGSTKDRLERANRFNASDVPVFLISLKAGGTGLNLTGADYVVHFDPWWNPAVEDQATDRAHRIGQTRHVFSYKLIAKDTIEEKVLALQERKRRMVRDVLGSEEFTRQLSREDLDFLLAPVGT